MSDYMNTDREQKLAKYFEDYDHSSEPGPASEGMVQPWEAYDGRLELGQKLQKYTIEADECLKMVNEDSLYNGTMVGDLKNSDNDIDESLDHVVASEHVSSSNIEINGLAMSNVIPTENVEKTKDYLKETSNALHKGADLIRNMEVKESNPENAAFIKHGAERMAKWFDGYADVVANENGSIAKGAARSATFSTALSMSGSLPRMSPSSVDKIEDLKERQNAMYDYLASSIRTLGQLDVKDGVNIFDDYMDVMEGSTTEMQVEFHRQEMEATGWDQQKDAIYRNELRASHEKIVSAFDRLKNVYDDKQYDKVLNNSFDELVGTLGQPRNKSAMVGYMKGEMQAIDMGYPSDELFGLGLMGQIDGMVDRQRRQDERKLADLNKKVKELEEKARAEYKKGESREKIRAARAERDAAKEERKAFKNGEYKKHKEEAEEFNALKNEVWGKEYNGPESTFEAIQKSNAFVEKHPQYLSRKTTKDLFEKQCNKLAGRAKEFKDMLQALGDFNTKRTDKWLSSESKEHKNLRESAEALERDMKAYKSGVYQDGPNKGMFIKEEERLALRDSIEKRADEVAKGVEAYTKSHKNPSTEAGKQRKAGAEALLSISNAMKSSIARDRERDALTAAGADYELHENMMDALSRDEHSIKANEADELSQIRQTHQSRFEKINAQEKINTKDSLMYTHSLAGIVAGRMLQNQVDKGKMSPGNAAKNMADAVSKLENDKVIKDMANEAINNPKVREELGNMSAGEVFAKFAMKKEIGKMMEAQAKQKNAPQKQLENQMQEPKK